MGVRFVTSGGLIVRSAMFAVMASAVVLPAANAQSMTDGAYRVVIDTSFGEAACPSNLEMEAITAKGEIQGGNDTGGMVAGTITNGRISGSFSVPDGTADFSAKKAGDRFEGRWSDSYGECSGVITLIPK